VEDISPAIDCVVEASSRVDSFLLWNGSQQVSVVDIVVRRQCGGAPGSVGVQAVKVIKSSASQKTM